MRCDGDGPCARDALDVGIVLAVLQPLDCTVTAETLVMAGAHAQSRDCTKAIGNAQTPEYRPSNDENVLTIFNSKLLAPSADHRPCKIQQRNPILNVGNDYKVLS